MGGLVHRWMPVVCAHACIHQEFHRTGGRGPPNHPGGTLTPLWEGCFYWVSMLRPKFLIFRRRNSPTTPLLIDPGGGESLSTFKKRISHFLKTSHPPTLLLAWSVWHWAKNGSKPIDLANPPKFRHQVATFGRPLPSF